MKKSDILICGFMYAFSLFSLALTQEFPREARYYPEFVIGLLVILTTVRVMFMFRDYRGSHEIINDIPVVFDGFLPRQFWVLFGLFLVFFVLLQLIGFYPAAMIYLFLSLKYFRIRPLYIVLILVVMAGLIFGTFDTFLNVPLPKGMLLEDFL